MHHQGLMFKDIETLNRKAAYKRNRPIYSASEMPRLLDFKIKPDKYSYNPNKNISLRERLQIEYGLTGEELDNEYKKSRALKHRLLSFGGVDAELEILDPDTDKILERGQFWYADKVIWMPYRPNQCHKNSCDLWVENKDKSAIATGYALSEDGVWYVHSWVIKFNYRSASVVETTPCKRKAYFGYVMTPDECEKFDADNL